MTKHAVPIPSNSVTYPSREPVDAFSGKRKRCSNFARCLKRHRVGRSKLFTTPTPSPRLVGIELNPGPSKASSSSSRKPAVSINVTEVKRSPGKSRKRAGGARPAKNNGGGAHVAAGFQPPRFKTTITEKLTRAPGMDTYLDALTHPFTAPQPRLGFGCFVGSMKYTGWYENPTLTMGAFTHFAVAVVPSIHSNAIRVYTAGTSGTTLAASTITPLTVTNQSSLATFSQSSRIISSELRVKVRTPATSLPGSLGGFFLPDETVNNLEALTYAQLTQNQKYYPFSSEGPNIGGAVQYRPIDATSFEFSAEYANAGALTATNALPQMVVIGTGWAASSFAVEMTLVVNFETLGGLDQSGQGDFEPSLVTSGLTVDMVGDKLAFAGPPVVPSISAIEMLDHGLTHAQNRSTYFANGISIAPPRK
jgi:hypothetical protein